jgi:DnaJ like chaperone protein
VESIAAPVADHLEQRQAALDKRSAHAILGVAPGAGPSAIRAAYRALALQYHPDRFAGAGLPHEMADYAAAMFARINAAYRFLLDASTDASAQP